MKKLFLILFVMIVLIACSNEKFHYDYTFKGEGEHWKVEYSINGTETLNEKDGITVQHSNEYRDEFILTYKGDLKELSSVEFLEYSYETSTGGGSGKKEFDEPPKEITFKFAGSVGNGEVIDANEVIRVNIKWNGYEESFELQNASSSSVELNSSIK